jgi:hypothetical protein
MLSSLLRDTISRLLDWRHAHVDFEGAISGVPPELRGTRPPGYPHSIWELLEHVRITQLDLLRFCMPEPYVELEWPADYWPATQGPTSPEDWDTSIESVMADRLALQALATDPSVDLTAVVPNGTSQTYLREIFLVADHTSYHVGQIVAVRRMLGIWRG